MSPACTGVPSSRRTSTWGERSTVTIAARVKPERAASISRSRPAAHGSAASGSVPARLVRDARRLEQELRGVEIWQGAAIDERRGRGVRRAQRLDSPCVRKHFLVSIAAADPAAIGAIDLEPCLRRPLPWHPHLGRVRPETPQPREQVLADATRGDDVQAVEAGRLRQQLEVDGPEPLRVGMVIGDADDHVRQAPRTDRSSQGRVKRALIQAVERRHTRVEDSARLAQEPRLQQQAFGATIRGRFVLEPDRGLLEPGRGIVPETRHLIVEAQHLGDQSRAQQERRAMHARRLPGAGAHHHLARERGQARRIDARSAMPCVVQVVARQQARYREAACGAGRDVMIERVLQRDAAASTARREAVAPACGATARPRRDWAPP